MVRALLRQPMSNRQAAARMQHQPRQSSSSSGNTACSAAVVSHIKSACSSYVLQIIRDPGSWRVVPLVPSQPHRPCRTRCRIAAEDDISALGGKSRHVQRGRDLSERTIEVVRLRVAVFILIPWNEGDGWYGGEGSQVRARVLFSGVSVLAERTSVATTENR